MDEVTFTEFLVPHLASADQHVDGKPGYTQQFRGLLHRECHSQLTSDEMVGWGAARLRWERLPDSIYFTLVCPTVNIVPYLYTGASELTGAIEQQFWMAAKEWQEREAHIRVRGEQSWDQREFVGTVVGVEPPSITFLDLQTQEELTLPLGGAEFRHHPFEPIEVIRAFAAIIDGLPFAACAFYELRQFKSTN